MERKPLNLLFSYFTKGHNSGTSKVKSVKIELDLPLVVPNNISKFQNILSKLTKVMERKPKTGRTDGKTDGKTERRTDGRTVKGKTKCPVAVLRRGHKNDTDMTK